MCYNSYPGYGTSIQVVQSGTRFALESGFVPIVPGVILATLLFSIIIVRCTSGDERQTSARAGFWAGVVLMVVFVISQWQSLKTSTFAFGSLPQLNLESAGLGFIIGFVFLWVVMLLLPTRMVGLISLILFAANTSALYSYFFIEGLRSTILFLTPGIAFSALLHIVFFPNSITVDRETASQEQLRR